MEAAYNIYTNECFSGTGESGVVDERIGGEGVVVRLRGSEEAAAWLVGLCVGGI